MNIDRQKAIEVAKHVLETKPPMVIFDTETSGIGPNDVILEIAMMDTQGSVLLNTLVRWDGIIIPEEATKVHGITVDDLKESPTWVEVYPQIQAILRASGGLVAYNIDFDARMLAQSNRAAGITSCGRINTYCAMKIYANYRGDRSDNRGYKWYKLTQACAHEKVTVDNAHRAIGDVKMTLELLKKIAQNEVQGA